MGLALVVVIVCGGAGLVYRQHHQFSSTMVMRTASTLGPVATLVAISLSVNDVEDVDDWLAELTDKAPADMPILYLAAYGHDGLVRTSATPTGSPGGTLGEFPDGFIEEALASPAPLWCRYREPHRWLLAASMPAVAGLREGTLVALFDVTHGVRQLHTSMLVAILVAIATLWVAFTTTWIGLDRTVVGPLARVAAAAQRLRDGDRSARSGVRGDNEVGVLAATFDAMAVDLQAYTEALEQRVSERTAEVHARQAELEMAHQQLAETNARLVDLNRKLEDMARVDSLTGAWNRRYFNELVELEFRRSRRTPHRWCLLMFDVDHFKQVNDSYGHQAGDAVLAQMADIFRSNLRTTDVLARYGGEEFVAILLESTKEAGRQVAEKLRTEVARSLFDLPDGRVIRVTVSLGLAAHPDDGEDPLLLLSRADAALYAAKRSGRNRSICWVEGMEPPRPV